MAIDASTVVRGKMAELGSNRLNPQVIGVRLVMKADKAYAVIQVKVFSPRAKVPQAYCLRQLI